MRDQAADCIEKRTYRSGHFTPLLKNSFGPEGLMSRYLVVPDVAAASFNCTWNGLVASPT